MKTRRFIGLIRAYECHRGVVFYKPEQKNTQSSVSSHQYIIWNTTNYPCYVPVASPSNQQFTRVVKGEREKSKLGAKIYFYGFVWHKRACLV